MEKLIGIQKINIVLIEDNNLFRKTLSNFINQSEEMCCNYSFATYEVALIEDESKNLEPDIILLDIGLPGMNGVDCIPQIKKNYPDSKIVMLTIQDDDESVFKAICRGASGYLLKDSTSANIFESVKEVLNGGAPMNSSIAAKVLRMFRNYIPLKKEYNLSTREKEILKLLVDGLSKRLIAEKLYLSYHTIDSHIRKIYEKLEVHSNSSAVAKALREKLI